MRRGPVEVWLDGAEEFLLASPPPLVPVDAGAGAPPVDELHHHGLGVGEGLEDMPDVWNEVGSEEGFEFEGG